MIESAPHILFIVGFLWAVIGAIHFLFTPSDPLANSKQMLFEIVVSGPIIWVLIVIGTIWGGLKWVYDWLGD